jgi:hypothetical protein
VCDEKDDDDEKKLIFISFDSSQIVHILTTRNYHKYMLQILCYL